MNIRILTHSGEEILAYVEDFDAQSFNEQCNNPEINTVELGGNIISRIDIKLVSPI